MPDSPRPAMYWEFSPASRPIITATVIQTTDSPADVAFQDVADATGRGGARALWTEVVPAREKAVSFSMDTERELRVDVLDHDKDHARVRLRLERGGVLKVDTTVRVDVGQPFLFAI